MGARHKSGSRYSDTACSMACRVFIENGNEPMTISTLLDAMNSRWKRVPTTNSMANTISKSGYFNKVGLVKQSYTTTSRGQVNLWEMNTEECYKRGWLNIPFENRPINDPMHEGTTTRYTHSGAPCTGTVRRKEPNWQWLTKPKN